MLCRMFLFIFRFTEFFLKMTVEMRMTINNRVTGKTPVICPKGSRIEIGGKNKWLHSFFKRKQDTLIPDEIYYFAKKGITSGKLSPR